MEIAIGKRPFAFVLVLALSTSALIAIAILPLGFYRFLGAVSVANLLLVLLQPAARRMGGATTAAASERPRAATYRLAFTLRGTPSEAAVEEARRGTRAGPRESRKGRPAVIARGVRRRV